LVCMVKERSHCTARGRVSLYYVSTEHFDCTDTDCHSETRSWDVRTKKVTYDVIPTIEGIIGIANYGTTATLFTLGHNYTAQQYDITPNQMPIQVQNVQHVPANTPPTPPTTLEEQKNSRNGQHDHASTDAPRFVVLTDAESSADEGGAMSPLQKIALEMDSLDQLESEIRDKVMPLSPVSSRASSVSSRSSQGGRRQQKYLYDQPSSSRASSNTGYDGTEFSFGAPAVRQAHDSMSIRSGSTRASRMSNPRPRTSALRKEILRSPEESNDTSLMDLFAFTKARLRDLPFKSPNYGNVARTPEVLQREMLKVVFGWSESITNLVREEMRRHRPGSASVIMLAKWLGDMGADSMASMIGSESMTSSDWMLLALSSIGHDSQKKVGEAFVQRLLEKGDIHPAVAILLGLGEHNDAVEVYVSQGYLMEAVVLTCLAFPSDWGRQSFLLRKWGEVAVQNGQPELAVRIFSCASVEMSEPWFSPRAQDAVYAAQQVRLTDPPSAGPANSPPLSPPSVTGSGRLTARNASLKLITTFGAKGVPLTLPDDPTPLAAVVATPIAESAISPRGGGFSRLRAGEHTIRDPSEARTATPGGFARKKRLPSKSDIARAKQDAAEMATPLTAACESGPRAHSRPGSRQRGTSSVSSIPEPATALRPSVYNADQNDSGSENERSLPPPSHGIFRKRKDGSQKRSSREKKPEGLMVDILDTRLTADVYSAGPSTHDTVSTNNSIAREQTRAAALSPPLTGTSLRNAKNKAIDAYISSVEEARLVKRQERAGSRARAESQTRGQGRMRTDSRTSRASSRARDRSEGPRLDGAYYIQPGKRSPSSPVPMSPEEIAQATFKESEAATTDDEAFYKISSPIEARKNGPPETLQDRRWSGDDAQTSTFASRTNARTRSPNQDRLQVNDERGRGDARGPGSASRSPSSPLPMLPDKMRRQDDDTQSDGRRIFVRSQSSARHQQDLQSRRAASRTRHDRSTSRRPTQRTGTPGMATTDTIPEKMGGSDTEDLAESQRRPRTFTRKQLAAKELEDRRLSLARRPSAPPIPTPGELTPGRPRMSPRSQTDLSNNPLSFMPPLSRSATVDPDTMSRYGKTTGTSTTSAPIGLPATPRAMRHPRYMNADPDRDAPPVPGIPDTLSSLSGSNLSQLTGSALSQMASSSLSQAAPSSLSQVSSVLSEPLKEETEADSIGPLLPSTVFGMKGPQGPTRSASAPPEKLMGRQAHPAYNFNLPASTKRLSGGRGHVRKISPPSLNNIDQPEISSIDQALYSNNYMDQDIIIVPEEDPQGPPIMLPQLQHLAGPPPPPPPPTMFQQLQPDEAMIIDVAIGGDDRFNEEVPDLSETPTSFPQSFPQPMSRAQTVSPSMHRSHRRGSASTSDTFGSRMRGVADKMRSNSRSRGMNQLPTLEPYKFQSPYETVLPPMPSQHSRKSSISRAKSPYEQAMADQEMQMPPPPPPPPAPPAAGEEYRFAEVVVPPRSQSAMGGYRNPKEIRANMPPSHLQPGVYTPLQGGFL
jgi:hypothetical protein